MRHSCFFLWMRPPSRRSRRAHRQPLCEVAIARPALVLVPLQASVLLFAAFLIGSSFSAHTAQAQDAPSPDSSATVAAAHVLQAPLQADLLPGLDITYVRAAIVLLPAERRIRGSVSYHVSRRAGAAADSLILRAGAVGVERVQIRPPHLDSATAADSAALDSAAADSSLAPPPAAWTHRADTLRIGLPAAAHPSETGAGREEDVFVVVVDYETARVGYDVRDRGGWKAVWTPSRPDAAHWFPHPLAWSDPFSADVRVKTPPGWRVHFPAGHAIQLPGPDHAVHVWQPDGEHLAHGLGFLAMDVDSVLEREEELAAEAATSETAEANTVAANTVAQQDIEIPTTIFRLPAGHPSHYWPSLVLISDDMTLETDPLMGRFQALADEERVWAAPLATATYWTDSWLHEAAILWRALETLGAREGAAARQRVLETARRRYLAESYRRPLVWDRWQSPFDLEDAHARWKGLWVLEMLASRTSAAAVHEALRTLRAEALLAPVDTEDFRLALESAISSTMSRDLASFLDTWIYSAGHPRLSVIHSHDAAAERLTVIVEQTQEGPFIPPAFELEGQLVISSIGGSVAFPFQTAERSARSARDMPVRPRYVQFRSSRPLLMEFDPPPDEVDVTAWIRDSERDAERVAFLATLADGEPNASLLIGLRPLLEAAPDHVRVAALPVLAAMAPSESALRLVESLSLTAGRDRNTPDASGQSATATPFPDLLFERMSALEAFSTDRAAELALETANTSQDGFLLERAVRLLVDYREDMAWQVLQSALVTDSERDRIRRLAIRLIEASGRGARERLAALLPLTENPHHPTTRGEALLAAARIDPESATVRRRTAAWLPDERPALRAAAIEALDVLPEGAVPAAAIIDALERETRPALRRALLSVLLNRDA